MDGEEAALGEREQFEQPFGFAGGGGPAGLKVARVVAHRQGDLKRRGRLHPPDRHGLVTPAPSPGRHEIARAAAVEFERKGFVETGR